MIMVFLLILREKSWRSRIDCIIALTGQCGNCIKLATQSPEGGRCEDEGRRTVNEQYSAFTESTWAHRHSISANEDDRIALLFLIVLPRFCINIVSGDYNKGSLRFIRVMLTA